MVTVETSDKLGATAACGVLMRLIGSLAEVTHRLEAGCPALTTATKLGGKPTAGLAVPLSAGSIGDLTQVELSLATDAWGTPWQQQYIIFMLPTSCLAAT